MSRRLGCAAPTTPVTSHQDTVDQAFLEALSASDNESNKAGTHTGRHTDGPSGGPYIVESSKPLWVSQEGGAIEIETLPQPHAFTIYPQRDDTPLVNGDHSQELLTHQNATCGGLKGFQLPDEGSCCSTRSSAGHGTFDPFTHHLSSPYVERRPPYRYATLIGMEILNANDQRLTLVQIYQWISDNFTHYSMADSGWQNSIRHNLSLNKNFVKIERSKHDRGKGHYWGIKPGQEHLFVPEERNDRRCRPATDMDTGNLQLTHASTDQPCPTSRVVVAPNIQQAARTPDLSYKTRQDCPDHIAQSPCVTVQDINLVREKGPQHGALVPSPQTVSKASRSPRKRGASPSLWHRRHHRLETRPWSQVDSVVEDHRHDLPDITPIAHVDPARLMLQTGIKRSRFGEGRAETEIARIRKSCAKGHPNYEGNTVPRATWATSSFSRVDSDFDAFHLPYGSDALRESSSSFSPKSILRGHRKSVRALLGSSSSPVSPSDEADV